MLFVLRLFRIPSVCATFLLAIVLLLSGYAQSFADMYKYQDESGAVCITNSLDSVPKQFRKSMAVVREEVPKQENLLAPLPAKAPARARKSDSQLLQGAAGVRQDATIQSTTQDGARTKHIKTALIVVAMICACFILSRLSSTLGAPRLGTVMFLAIMLAGGVYLYGMYVQELRSVFNGLRKDAFKIKNNVETREHKTDNMLKEIQEQTREMPDQPKEQKDD